MSIYETFFECSGSEVGVEVYLPSSAKSFSLCFCSPVKMYIQGTSKLLLSTSARPVYPACCSTFQRSSYQDVLENSTANCDQLYQTRVSLCYKALGACFLFERKDLARLFQRLCSQPLVLLYIVVRVWVKNNRSVAKKVQINKHILVVSTQFLVVSGISVCA